MHRDTERHSCRGMTLIELLTALVIGAILLSLAVPTFHVFVRSNRLSTATNDLVTALTLARSEAVARSVPVRVCASTDQASCAGTESWTEGLVVFNDDDADGVLDGAPEGVLEAVLGPQSLGKIDTTGNTAAVSFTPLGTVAAATALQFFICIDGSDTGRRVTLAVGGHTVVAEFDCSGS